MPAKASPGSKATTVAYERSRSSATAERVEAPTGARKASEARANTEIPTTAVRPTTIVAATIETATAPVKAEAGPTAIIGVAATVTAEAAIEIRRGIPITVCGICVCIRVSGIAIRVIRICRLCGIAVIRRRRIRGNPVRVGLWGRSAGGRLGGLHRLNSHLRAALQHGRENLRPNTAILEGDDFICAGVVSGRGVLDVSLDDLRINFGIHHLHDVRDAGRVSCCGSGRWGSHALVDRTSRRCDGIDCRSEEHT